MPPSWKCKQCGRILNRNIAGVYCPLCGFRGFTAFVLLLCLMPGCDESRKPRPNPDNHDVVIVDTTSVKNIHRQSALARAGAYDKLADAVQAGSVKTVNEAYAFMNPMIIEAGKKYTEDVNKLRQERLRGAAEDLPPDAADTFRQFAKEYRDAAK